jgi:predicted transposase YbfD/YdcC
MNCTLSKPLAEELTQAIRCHWCLEFNNWIRDVTYNKDNIKTKSGNHSQIMALLRRLAIEPIRKTSPKNFYEKDVCSYSKALAVPIS